MKHFIYKGRRIRASDKNLVFRFVATSLTLVFILVLLDFHGKRLMTMDWQKVSLTHGGSFQLSTTPYLIFSVVVATAISLIVVCFYYHFQRDHVKQLIHRQKLARMILENKWYESEQIQSD